MKKISLFLLWLLCAGVVVAQSPRKVAVYVTGEVNAGNKKIAGQKIVSGISANPDFSATEKTVSFIAELAKDHDYKVNAPVNESRLREIGRGFGVDYVVVAELTEAMGELVISSRMLDVQGETPAVSAESIVKVRQASDLMRTCEENAKQLLENLKKQQEPAEELVTESAAAETPVKAELQVQPQVKRDTVVEMKTL
ncbi:MAG: hypothetical protein NC324_09065 [Bacteroides sp.]|nr:hypothetical protein [Bacteroides sp.]